MSIKLKLIVPNITTMLVLSILSISFGFLLFWLIAGPIIGNILTSSISMIAARFFPIAAIIALALTALGAIWVIVRTTRCVTNPLTKLKRAAFEIRDGNLGYELVVTGNDEFSSLAESFEQMRVRLKNGAILEEKSKQERTSMMASITHDLKTPITSILGYAEGIIDKVASTPEKVNEYAKVISKNALSLRALSDDLLLLSKLESSQLPVDLEQQDFGKLISEVASELANIEPAINITTNIESEINVRIDKEKISRVLLNILQNAVKYKNPQYDKVDVAINLKSSENSALLTICDNGMGITQEDLPHVFDEFYRADASRGVEKGSGLGLSIAKYLIELHNGKIWIKSNKDQGITVSIILKAEEK